MRTRKDPSRSREIAVNWKRRGEILAAAPAFVFKLNRAS